MPKGVGKMTGPGLAFRTAMAGKILLVDDYTTTRNALAFSLRQEGYQVVAVCDGNEAARRLSIESFDLVLSDFAMPGMDGLALTRHIGRVAPQTPIIIMSGSVEINRGEALSVGAFDFVEKPFVLNSLIAKIELAFATGAPNNQFQNRLAENRQFIG
ncbi:MAG TPA: response regulator [Candidatus Binatia bacterium]